MGSEKADYYRERAKECEDMAKRLRDPLVSADFIACALHWAKLAEIAESGAKKEAPKSKA
jgi:hypothetical protein